MNTKDKILTGAFELFKKRGFKGVTMDEIAKSLSMSKRTIYENFDDKRELIRTIIEIEIRKSTEQYEYLMKSNDNIYTILKQIDNIHKETYKNTSPLLKSDLKKYYPTIITDVTKLFYETRSKVIRLTLMQGIKQGLFLESTNINTISLLFENTLDFSIKKIEEKQFSEKDMSDCCIALLRGISTRKGFEYMNSYKQE